MAKNPTDKSNSTLSKSASGATRDAKGRFVKTDNQQKSGKNRNPIDNLPINVGGRNHRGQFTKKDDFRKLADKQFPVNKTDDVEELVSPTKPPRDRKPYTPRDKSRTNDNNTPFFDDPIFDLGTNDEKLIKQAEEERLKSENKVKKAMAQAILDSLENKKMRNYKKEIKIREMKSLNDNDVPMTVDEIQEAGKKHLEHSGVKKYTTKGTTKPKPFNENDPELSQEELAKLRNKHLNDVKNVGPRRKMIELDPMNDNGQFQPGKYARSNKPTGKPIGNSTRSNSYNNFSFKQKPNFKPGQGYGVYRRSRALSTMAANIGPHNSGMRTVNGKVTFKPLKPPKEPKDFKSSKPDLNTFAGLAMGVFGLIAGAISLIKTTLQNFGNMLLDNLVNPVLKKLGMDEVKRFGALSTPNANTTNPPGGAAANTLQPNTPGINPNTIQSMDPITVTGSADYSPTTKFKPAPGIGNISAPGANKYTQEFNQTGTQTQAIQQLMSLGWSKPQAAGIAANLHVESNFRTNAKGDGGQAYGIAQWHPDRQAVFQKIFGKDIRNSTFEEQLNFVHYELTQGQETSAGKILASATDAGKAAAIVDQYYERSDGTARGQRIKIAQQYMSENANGVASSNEPTQSTAISADASSLGPSSTVVSSNPIDIHHNTGFTPNQPVISATGAPSVNPGSIYNQNPNGANNMLPAYNQNTPIGGPPQGTSLLQFLMQQSGNLRQGKMHPFTLPGINNPGGINPMQLLANASVGGSGGITNIIRQISNSPSFVQQRQNFPSMYANINGQNQNISPNVGNQPDPFSNLTNDITQGLGGITSTIMNGITQLGKMITENKTSDNASIAQIHIRDPRIASFDQTSAFVQRNMIKQ